mmetsp:Transcript_82779/g.208403  ORF Transcript_82779/g.208403 Transcript_82779/m.208403 type:complete len:217 (+) Transcript_82779:1095-1745(+)
MHICFSVNMGHVALPLEHRSEIVQRACRGAIPEHILGQTSELGHALNRAVEVILDNAFQILCHLTGLAPLRHSTETILCDRRIEAPSGHVLSQTLPAVQKQQTRGKAWHNNGGVVCMDARCAEAKEHGEGDHRRSPSCDVQTIVIDAADAILPQADSYIRPSIHGFLQIQVLPHLGCFGLVLQYVVAVDLGRWHVQGKSKHAISVADHLHKPHLQE